MSRGKATCKLKRTQKLLSRCLHGIPLLNETSNCNKNSKFLQQFPVCELLKTVGSLNIGRTWLHRRSPGQLSRHSDSLRALRFAVPNPAGERFSASVQTGFGAHPASCTICTGSFPPGLKRPGRGVDDPPIYSVEVKERVELYLQHLLVFMACDGVNFAQWSFLII